MRPGGLLEQTAASYTVKLLNTQYATALKTNAIGKVNIHEDSICTITRPFPSPDTVAIAKIDPTDTCVVDTGIPWMLAVETNRPVIRFAVNP